MRNEIVFIDAGVRDQAAMLDAIKGSPEIIILEPDGDGMEQIERALAGRSKLSAIHTYLSRR